MKKLKCLANYINEPRRLRLEAGDTLDVDDRTALELQADSPGTFEVLPDEEPTHLPAKREVHEARAFDEPPHTTAMKNPRTKAAGKD